MSASKPILAIRNLSISYSDGQERTRVVHDVSFTVQPGEVVALVGESGSGKSTTAQSVIGLLAENGAIYAGEILLNGENIAGWKPNRLRAIRGAVVSLVPQDPSSSLNPVATIGAQVREVLEIHGRISRKEADRRVVELLGHVGLSEPELRTKQYPHELSGGMRQRVLIAIAIALRPALIIADEPTSALDVTVQKRILDLIDTLRAEYGTAVLLVTHDLGVAADRADRIVVLKNGAIQEQGATAEVLGSPKNSYTRKLLADAPSLRSERVRAPFLSRNDPNVVVRNLVQEFDLPAGRKFRAVNDISFSVERGTTHAIVGESGSGKTTTIRTLAGFQKPTSGTAAVGGFELGSLNAATLRQFRRKVQLVYQNPWGSLDPGQTIRGIVEEPLLNFDPIAKDERTRRVEALIERVGLPATVLERKPHALSGGQKQRVAIARALVLQPEILVLDEAVSALDVTVQAQILELLSNLQRDFGLTYLFVSHDLSAVRLIADTVSVLQSGKQVDHGTVSDIFTHPQSAYTRDLIDAIPGKTFPAAADTPSADR